MIPAFETKEVRLEKLMYGMRIYIDPSMPQGDIGRMIAYRVSGYVWSQDAGKRVEFSYPSDWWQAFKEKWFPKWLLKKYPARYTTKTFVVKATYPDLAIEHHAPVLRLLQYTDSQFSDR